LVLVTLLGTSDTVARSAHERRTRAEHETRLGIPPRRRRREARFLISTV